MANCSNRSGQATFRAEKPPLVKRFRVPRRTSRMKSEAPAPRWRTFQRLDSTQFVAAVTMIPVHRQP
jgi:hypothetical protein